MKFSTNALLLLQLFAAIASSSTLLAAADSPPAGITCVAFHLDETTTSLQMNECLTAGNAICSSDGSWAFGIDPIDQRIKLWEGDQVRFYLCIYLFACMQ